MQLNVVHVSGTIIKKHAEYSVIKVVERKGMERIVIVWDLSEDFLVGKRVEVKGELQERVVGLVNPKFIWGVVARKVKIFKKRKDFSTIVFSGIITDKRTNSISNLESKVIELNITLNENVCKAYMVGKDFSNEEVNVGVEVILIGTLFNRVHSFSLSEISFKWLTTDIIIKEFFKV